MNMIEHINKKIDSIINSWPETKELSSYGFVNYDIQLAYDRIVPFGSNIALHCITL